MADVRAYPGTPVIAQFTGNSTPTMCAPIVVDSSTGDIYTVKTGDVIVKTQANSAATGLTATGTNQATAYALTAKSNSFSTVAAGTGVILTGSVGDDQLVYNGGANPMTVYPASGAGINGLPANAGALLPTNTACNFTRLTSTLYTGILSR